MMKILIIGGSRFIGKAIAAVFLAHDHEVTLFNRGNTEVLGCSIIRGDVENLTDFKTKFESIGFDVVVHCIAYTEKHALDLADVFASSQARVLVLSSVDCYEAFQQLNRGLEVSDYPIDETMPTSSIRYYWRGLGHHAGGEFYDKNLMTECLMKAFAGSRFRPTVFRLPQVYGPGDFQFRSRHGPIIRRILDQRTSYVVSDVDYNKLQTFGYIENIAAAVYHSLSTEKTAGQIYNLGERKTRSWRRWVELFGNAAGWTFEFAVVPEHVLRHDTLNVSSPPLHLIFDCDKFYRDTCFVDPVGIETCISRTLDWALKNTSCLGEAPNYADEARIARDYYAAISSIVQKP